MASEYNISVEQKRVLEEKAARRLALRAEFQKLAYDPRRHATAEGGHVFDPAIYRFNAMKASSYEHFRPNLLNVLIGLGVFVIPYVSLLYVVKKSRDDINGKIGRGEVASKDRAFKFA